MCKQNKTAFTLIELLVVIAIISLLVSILLPSLSKAKEQAQLTACMANMKSLGSALFTYAAEYDGLPPEAWDGNTTWARKLKNREYMTSFICPAHKPVYPVNDDEELRSYATNAWTTLNPEHNEFYSGGGGYVDPAKLRSIDRITQPSITGLAIEVWRGLHWSASFQENSVDKIYSEVNHLFMPHDMYATGIGENIGLHGEKRNQSVLFYDGHVDSYPFEYFDGSLSPENIYHWKWTIRSEGEL